MLKSYESVSYTAIRTAYARTFSNIPYSKETYEWLSKNCSEEVILNKLLAPEMEARYKLIDKLLKETGITQILELASGYSSRGLIFSEAGYQYVEMDLEGVSNNKKRMINEIFKMNDNLNIVSGNALNIEDYYKCNKFFDDNQKLAIINEGLLRYLTFDEKRKVAKNIYQELKKYGGVWITCDITPMKYIEVQNKLNIATKINKNDKSLRQNLNDRFLDEEHIRSFFGEIGFNDIELHHDIEVKAELKSLDSIGMDKDYFDELLKYGYVAIFKVQGDNNG